MTLAIAWFIWRIRDFLENDRLKDYSKTSVPLLKASFNLVFRSQGDKTYLINVF